MSRHRWLGIGMLAVLLVSSGWIAAHGQRKEEEEEPKDKARPVVPVPVTEPDKKDKFRAECEAAASSFLSSWSEAASKYALGPTRVQFQNKDPRGWAEFARQLGEHSPRGQALTMRGVQMRRPSLYELVEDMKKIELPALIVTGDEDDPCLEPALLMKRSMPNSGLVVLPRAGHTINIEEPEAFNRALFEFFTLVDEGRAAPRDPRSLASGILGYKK